MHENQDSEYLRCQRAGERLVSKMDPGPFSGQKQRWKTPRGPPGRSSWRTLFKEQVSVFERRRIQSLQDKRVQRKTGR